MEFPITLLFPFPLGSARGIPTHPPVGIPIPIPFGIPCHPPRSLWDHPMEFSLPFPLPLQFLRKRSAELEEQYRDTTVPRPSFW